MSAPRDPPESVFEGNLRALLRRAYEPALPSEAFRARAETALLASLPPPRARPARRLTLLRPALALAATLLLALTAWWWLGHDAEGSARPDGLLAQGLVAVRDARDADWHALQRSGDSAVTQLGEFLELATPDRASLDVLIPGADHVLAHPASRASLAASEPEASAAGADTALAVDWAAGALKLRHATGAAWRIETAAGPIVLAQGWLDVAYVPGADGLVSARLHEGRAWLVGAHGQLDLPLDRSVLLEHGGLAPEPTADAGKPVLPEPGTARPPEPIVVPPLHAATLPPPAPRELAGRVTDAATGAPVTSFRLCIVRDHIVEGDNPPLARLVDDADGRFSWTDVEPETWALYVQADGYAVASRLGLAVGEEHALAPLDIALERGTPARGFVVDASSGAPIEGAVVLSETDVPLRNLPIDTRELPPEATALARTAADGSFELPRLSSGAQVLRVTAAGFAPLWVEPLPVRAGEAVDGLLARLQPGAVVAGSVATAAGEPVPQAIVLAWHADPTGSRSTISFGVALTGADGRYTLSDLPPGDAQILLLGLASEGGSAGPMQIKAMSIASGAATTVDFVVGGASGRLYGRVLDAHEQPVVSLDVSVEPKGVAPGEEQASWRGSQSASDGTYEITNLRPGDYDVFLGSPNGGCLTAYGDVTVSVAGTAFDVRIPAGRVSGAITSLADGSAVPAGIAMLFRESQPDAPHDGRADDFAAFMLAGRDGRFAFERLRPGRYRLVAQSMTGLFGAEYRSIDVAADGSPIVGSDVALGPGGSVAVSVRDAAGQPVAGARVALRDVAGVEIGFDRAMITDAQGRFVARGVKPGRWYVEVEQAGMQRIERAVEAQAGVEQPVDLVLAPGR